MDTNMIDDRLQWFDFKQRKLEEYVLRVLKMEIDDA